MGSVCFAQGWSGGWEGQQAGQGVGGGLLYLRSPQQVAHEGDVLCIQATPPTQR